MIYLAFLVLGLFLERFWPTPLLDTSLTFGAGLITAACGVIGLAAAFRALSRAKTPVDPYKATSALVVSGPYRWSRNPIYIADTLIYIGLALLLRSGWALAFTPALLWVLQVGVIAREEQYLERKFGDDYLRYKRQVRRWL